MFKKNKKTSISIESSGDSVSFNVYWDKNNPESISLFIRVLVMLNNGDLRGHIEKAIMHYGNVCNDEETANQILLTMKNIEDQVNKTSLENKYLKTILVDKKRNPIVPPDQVLNIFKNVIGR